MFLTRAQQGLQKIKAIKRLVKQQCTITDALPKKLLKKTKMLFFKSVKTITRMNANQLNWISRGGWINGCTSTSTLVRVDLLFTDMQRKKTIKV